MAGTETRYCANCGERISARSRFCPACGARQEDFLVADPEPVGAPPEPEPTPPEPEPTPPAPEAVPPPAPPPPEPAPAPRAEPLRERIGRVDPQAGELSGLLMGHLAVPSVMAAGLAALAAAAIVLVAGVLIALATPDASILGVVGRDGGLLTEGLRQAVSTLLAPVIDSGPLSAASGRLAPMIFVAIPIGAVAWATRWQLGRTEGARPAARIAWAAVVGLPFGLLMLAFAVLGGDSDVTNVSPSAGSAFGLGLLWGVIGGVLGAATALPLEGATEGRTAPPLVRRALTAAAATLRPLGALLIACTALGLVGWLVQVGADVDQVRAGRSTATALVEESLFAGEHGVHLAALASGARFTPDAPGALGLPFPVDQAGDVPGRDGGLRIFSYNDAMPAYVFLPALILLIGLLVLAALYAGFAAARAVGAATPPLGAAWGAVTGPAWAIAMSILTSLAGGLFHGDADGGSVFGLFLLLGAVLGAGGGVLAVSDARAPADRPITTAGAPDAG
ncbi:MAG TPA: zinc ribbon domain-containing protein [Solirubrobacteraceae bacterium]|nr:zinc ribbon domain-containing protein [Solirubrobacteraceae bacterium]